MDPVAPLADPLLGTSLGGRFKLVRKLGEGAMGAVYEAVDGEGQIRAVKIMQGEVAERSAQALTRFVNEARATAALQSPHIVTTFDGGVDEASRLPYLVMELLRGLDAEQLLERVGPIEPVTAVRMIVQGAHGLSAAHAAGIVHRDIKPSNLFLEERAEGAYTVKVCDFGTAKLTTQQDAAITKTGAFLGSPLYMSPEQTKSSKHVDARADVWSLGVTLYCLLSGQAPHESASSLADLLTRICTMDTPPLQDVAPWVEPSLAAVIHAALLREPDARWPSVAKFGRALLPHTQGDTRLYRDMLVATPADRKAQSAQRAALPAKAPQTVHPPTPDQDRLLGTTLAGRYRLIRELGRGGMGAVYEAMDPAGKKYAVKVVLDQATQSPDALRRFVREARASTEIKSPHVVAVVDADTDLVNRAPFIVMELLSGTDLDLLIESTGPLDPVVTSRVFRQACVGLSAAHDRLIVHRDIKPANIFLDAAPSGEVTVKICDFGIAKRTATESINQSTAALTATGGLLGSPIYMSPEQARNAKAVDLRTDIWSLCMSMYEALSGSRPWNQCTTVGELILAICTEELPPLSRVAPWVDPALAAVVERGLKREVAKRWAGIDELHRALEPFTQGSDALMRDALVGVPLEDRWKSVQRMVDAGAATVLAGAASSGGVLATSTLGANSISAVDTVQRRQRTNTGLVVAATAVAMLGGAAAVAFVTRTKWMPPPAAEVTATAVATAVPPPAASPAPPPVESTTAPQPAKSVAKVTIQPATSKVQVDGVPSEIVDGVLSVAGDPGDSVTVVAVAGSARVETRVTILKGGIADPSTINVVALKRAGGGARPAAAAATPKAAAPVPAAPAAASPAPAAAKAATPSFQKDW